MSLSIPFPLGWLLNKKAARVEVNISLAFFHWVKMALHPWPFVSDIAIFVLKGDVKLELTHLSGKPNVLISKLHIAVLLTSIACFMYVLGRMLVLFFSLAAPAKNCSLRTYIIWCICVLGKWMNVPILHRYWDKCKKLQFIHSVNGDGSKTAKIIKRQC